MAMSASNPMLLQPLPLPMWQRLYSSTVTLYHYNPCHYQCLINTLGYQSQIIQYWNQLSISWVCTLFLWLHCAHKQSSGLLFAPLNDITRQHEWKCAYTDAYNGPALPIWIVGSNRHDICQNFYATAVLGARILRKKTLKSRHYPICDKRA